MITPKITLLTDFGLQDSYVAQMKGVILSRAPNSQIIELSHDIQPQNVWQAAVFLSEAVPRFPADTIHLAVIDPGVGSARRIIAAKILDQTLVLPDNGLLSVLLANHHCTQLVQVEANLVNDCVSSNTFHGRDIMAPAVARLASGAPLEELGISSIEASELVRLEQAPPNLDGETISMTVFRIDHFGNVITNAPASWLKGFSNLGVSIDSETQLADVVPNYSEGAEGQLVALASSDGLLELAIRDGSAAKRLGFKCGQRIRAKLQR